MASEGGMLVKKKGQASRGEPRESQRPEQPTNQPTKKCVILTSFFEQRGPGEIRSLAKRLSYSVN